MKKHLVSAGVLAALFVAGSLMPDSPAGKAVAQPGQGQGSAPVHIVGPLPVPVTGTSTVSGTIAATQSGTWNFGVTNTKFNPVPVQQAIEPVYISKGLVLGVGSGSAGPEVVYAVPANKILALEFASYSCTSTTSGPGFDTSGQIAGFSLQYVTTFEGAAINSRSYLPQSAPMTGAFGGFVTGATPLQIYAEPGLVQLNAFRSSGSGGMNCDVSLNGRLLNR